MKLRNAFTAGQIAGYVGLVPSEESSGDRRRLGHISKQGNALLLFLLVEAAQVTVRSQAQWRSKKMALFNECVQLCAHIVLDMADIVREGFFTTNLLKRAAQEERG